MYVHPGIGPCNRSLLCSKLCNRCKWGKLLRAERHNLKVTAVLTVGFLPFVYFWVLRFPSPVPLAGKGQVENNHSFDTGVSSHAAWVQVAAPWVQSWQPPRVAPCYCLSTNGKPSPIGATPSHAAKLRRIDVTKGGAFFSSWCYNVPYRDMVKSWWNDGDAAAMPGFQSPPSNLSKGKGCDWREINGRTRMGRWLKF